jgi:photosystem II stability/assembly factor-like uncharacterized protein
MRAATFVILTLAVSLGSGPAFAKDGCGRFSSLHMIDARTGWAEEVEGGVGAGLSVSSVVRTTDGGIHWRDATPRPSSPHQIYRGTFSVGWLSALNAWISTYMLPQNPDGSRSPVLFTTSNGGETWKTNALPHGGYVDFINARDGWLVSGNGVYRSTDGGETWGKIGSAEFPGRFDPAGMTFLSATTGWITGSGDARDGIYLLVTRDGGHTWQRQKLSLPPQVTPPFAYYTVPPKFFTPRDGVLSQPHVSYVVLYVTHDGGTTWMPTTPLTFPQGYYRGGSFADVGGSLVDVNHGWVTDGDTLYATNDGGRRWAAIRPGWPFREVGGLDFISIQVGWATGHFVNAPFLLRTIDGGHTWTDLSQDLSCSHLR